MATHTLLACRVVACKPSSRILFSGRAATKLELKLQGVTFHDMTGSASQMLANETGLELARALERLSGAGQHGRAPAYRVPQVVKANVEHVVPAPGFLDLIHCLQILTDFVT